MMRSLTVIAILAIALTAHSQQQSTQPTLVIMPSAASFGNVTVGKVSPTLSFTATNYTTGEVRLVGESGLTHFRFQSGTCHLLNGDLLAPGASCAFTAEFAPAATGSATGSITLSTSLGPVVFSMSGTGVPAVPVSYSETVLYSFCSAEYCADGSTPLAGLVQDAAGNLYGTTLYGYAPNEYCDLNCGTVFKIDTAGHETVFHSFNPTCTNQTGCSDGFSPNAGLILDAAGNLYGTTSNGGSGIASGGGGTVFKLDPTGRETVLYNFCSLDNCADGQAPYAGLVRDTAGNLYGNTYQGGIGSAACNKTTGFDCSGGAGLVFKLDESGHETVLHDFCSVGSEPCADGRNTTDGLVLDAAGHLYGMTPVGGNGGSSGSCSFAQGCGTVFKLDNTGHETVLYNFCTVGYFCDDGVYPSGGVIRDTAGNLYGTTGYGTSSGAGTIFKIDSTGNETVLYDFCSAANCADGFRPLAGLIQDAAGNLYGTTLFGGTAGPSCPYNSNNCGTAFELDGAGNETVLYSFCSAANCVDGSRPQAALIHDAAGNLYGTTREGGANGKGTVFKLTPNFN